MTIIGYTAGWAAIGVGVRLYQLGLMQRNLAESTSPACLPPAMSSQKPAEEERLIVMPWCRPGWAPDLGGVVWWSGILLLRSQGATRYSPSLSGLAYPPFPHDAHIFHATTEELLKVKREQLRQMREAQKARADALKDNTE